MTQLDRVGDVAFFGLIRSDSGVPTSGTCLCGWSWRVWQHVDQWKPCVRELWIGHV